MPINWGSLLGPEPERRPGSGIDWASLGYDDEEELRKAKERKLAELRQQAAASSLVGREDTEKYLIDKKIAVQPGLRVGPEAEMIGQRQAAEMGIDSSPKNWGDVALGGAELFAREALDVPALAIRTQVDIDNYLKKKADEGNILAGAVRQTPPMLGVRASRALWEPSGLIGAAQRNPEAIQAQQDEMIANAPIPEVGATIAGMSRAGGMLLDPLAGIGAAAAGKAARLKDIASETLPIARMTSKLFSKEGGMPKDIYQILQQSKRAGEGADFDAAAAINKVDREVQRELDAALALESPARKEELNGIIDQVLTSGDPNTLGLLPMRLRKPVTEIRNRMDQESQGIIEKALFSKEAAEAFNGIVHEAGDGRFVSEFLKNRQTAKRGVDILRGEGVDPHIFFTGDDQAFEAVLTQLPDPKLRTTLRGARDAYRQMESSVSNFSPAAKQNLAGLGNHLDSLSPHRQAVAEHYLPVLGSISQNLGKYLRTSYRAFDDPRYAKVLSANEQAQKFQDLVDFSMKHQGMGEEEAKRWGKTVLQEIEQNAAENGRRASLFPEFPEAVKTALLKKQDIPEPIQEFLGINRDWRVGFQRGMVAAAEIGNEIKMWDDLMEQGAGKLFSIGADGKGAVNDLGHSLTYKVTKGNRMLAPEGQAVYTYPEIGEALDQANALIKEGTPLYRWQMANSLSRFGWTVANPATHAVNILGDVVLSLKAGDLGGPVKLAREAKHAVSSEFARIFGGVPAEELRELDSFRSGVAKRGGMTTGGAIAEERRHLGSLLGSPSRGVRGKLTPGPEEYLGVETTKTKVFEALKRATGKGMDLASSFFTAPDQAVRLAHIESKANQLAKAYPGWSTEQVMDEAVERGLNEIPSPEYSPKWSQKLRENFAFGSLITYPTEILRTTANSFEYALKDLRKALFTSGDQLAAEGADRAGLLEAGTRGLAGTIASISFVPTVAATAKMALNKAFPGANDPEKTEARKRFMPDYYKDANLMALGDDAKNNVVFMDWSPIDAYSNMGRAMSSALAAIRDDQSAFDAAMAGVKAIAEPYTGMQPLAAAGIEGLTNRSIGGTGAQIVNPEADTGDQAGAWTKHILKTLAPGPVKSGMKFLEAGQSGDSWIAEREMASWLGLRMYRFDTDKQITNTARGRQGEYTDVKKLRTDAVKKDWLSQGTPAVMEAEEEAQTAWVTEIAPEIVKDIEAARTLGKTDTDILRMFSSEAGIPKKHIMALLRGEVLPLSWNKD